MRPVDFQGANVTFAKDQPEYRPLPAYRDCEQTITCWELDAAETTKLQTTRRIWLRVYNFERPLQPQLPQIDNPMLGYVGESEPTQFEVVVDQYREAMALLDEARKELEVSKRERDRVERRIKTYQKLEIQNERRLKPRIEALKRAVRYGLDYTDKLHDDEKDAWGALTNFRNIGRMALDDGEWEEQPSTLPKS